MRYAPYILVFLVMGMVSCDSAVQEPTDQWREQSPIFSWVPNATDDTTFAVTSDVVVAVVTAGPFESASWDRREMRLQQTVYSSGHVILQSDGNQRHGIAATNVLICAVGGGPNEEVQVTVPRNATVIHQDRACTANDALPALMSEIQLLANSGALEDGLANSLLSKLGAAERSTEADRPNAANQLGAIINELEGNKNVLQPEEAQSLIMLAEQIIALLET